MTLTDDTFALAKRGDPESIRVLIAEVRRLSQRIADAQRAIPIEYRDGTEFIYELDTASQALADVAAALSPTAEDSQ